MTLLSLAGALQGHARPVPAPLQAELEARAHTLCTQLTQQALPYWHDTVDLANGGYLLADDATGGTGPATFKQLVSQARMVWGFSFVHRLGVRDPERDYLDAARQGYRFLIDHVHDPERGGYHWTTDLAGNPLETGNTLYGHAFVIFALVEHYRASKDPEALEHAVGLYRAVQRHGRDPQYGGWIEHWDEDWRPVLDPQHQTGPGIAGLKSANAHLHWYEALMELHAVTRAPRGRAILGRGSRLGAALREAERVIRRFFFPRRPGRAAHYRHPDWRRVEGPGVNRVSYGHNVEAAWLLVRGARLRDRPPPWGHVLTLIDHALAKGFDRDLGGLFSEGSADGVTDTTKAWWPQAELIAALTVVLQGRPDRAYADALVKEIDFVATHMIDPADGIWLWSVRADGTPLDTTKAHEWKAAYHDVRAIAKLCRAFAPQALDLR